MNQIIDQLKNKKIGILGLGINNMHLLRWLIKHEIRDVTVCDKDKKIKNQKSKIKIIGQNAKSIKWKLGENYLDNLDKFDIVFRTPGIPYLHHKIQEAKKAGVEISSQTKLFFDLCPCPIVGVTGTKGKGTTSSLIYELLKKIKNQKSKIKMTRFALAKARRANQNVKMRQRIRKVYLAGNIGRDPFEFVDELSKDDVAVLELSSFQLQDLRKSPNIAVVLNISSDHLDHHKDEKEYIEAKYNIVNHQTKNDVVIVNADYLTSVEFGARSAGQTYCFSSKKRVEPGTHTGISNFQSVSWRTNFKNKEDFIYVNSEGMEEVVCSTSDLRLIGRHNLENVAAAITTAKIFGMENENIKAVLREFNPLPHRLEFVREIDGIKYIDDSFSTTPDTTVAAIKSFDSPIVLICGGSSKNANFTELGKVIRNSTVKAIVLIGEEAGVIMSNQAPMTKYPKIINKNPRNMKDIVRLSRKEARGGDVVLLSPACASFDMFRNASERGDLFKKEVLKLKG